MKWSFIVFILSSLWIAEGFNITDDARNKTKRNLSREIQNYGDTGIVWLYNDNAKQPSIIRSANVYYPTPRPISLVGVPTPVKVFEPKVAAQQVLYEFEQTPTNAVSNVHVKQLFQPTNNFNQELAGSEYKPFLQHNQELAVPEYKPFIRNNQDLVGQEYKHFLQNNSPSILSSETIVSPVQHIQNHNQPLNNAKVHPLYNIQPQYFGPKKYLYVNGKIIYDPNVLQTQYPPTFFHSSQQFPQRPPVFNYVNHTPRQNLIPPPAHPPVSQNRFQPPPRSQLQPIETPSTAPPTTERPPKPHKHKVEEKPIEENKDEDTEESYYDHDEDSENYEAPSHEKYFDDEEDDHLSFRDHDDIEEDEEEDSNRGSTRYVSSKVKKYPKKFYKPEKGEIIYGSRYEYPEKKNSKDSGKKQHSMRYKSYKFSKDSGRYPKSEGIEGRQSQHVPVTHKQKIFKEKWYLSKSSADKERFDDSD